MTRQDKDELGVSKSVDRDTFSLQCSGCWFVGGDDERERVCVCTLTLLVGQQEGHPACKRWDTLNMSQPSLPFLITNLRSINGPAVKETDLQPLNLGSSPADIHVSQWRQQERPTASELILEWG